jgi:hypothetical protein
MELANDYSINPSASQLMKLLRIGAEIGGEASIGTVLIRIGRTGHGMITSR